jgi:hypothetical protein
MWTAGREWCAKPLVTPDYRGSFHDFGNWGHLYGIHVPDGLPEYDKLWICEAHRVEFLKLNSKGNLGTTIWEFDYNGSGKDVTWVPMKEVSVRIRTHMDEAELSAVVAEGLDNLIMDPDTGLESWTYLKVVAT